MNLAYKLVYTEGSFLEGEWRLISKSVHQIFASDLQGRLLAEAGSHNYSFDHEAREIHVVVATNVEPYEYTQSTSVFGNNYDEKPKSFTGVRLTPQSEEIYVGRVITRGHKDFDIFRAEVPPFLHKSVTALPEFK